MNLPFTERCVLLTGAGGSIGAALAQEVARQRPRKLILLDLSEGNLHQIDLDLSRSSGVTSHSSILGDIADESLLAELFEKEKPDVVLHTAACKHVPLMERNPCMAVRTNALATNLLAKMARACNAGTFVLVSTDKAVNPRSIMGASKRVAELAILRWSDPASPMRAVRLGNVLGSQGSVVPTFQRQIAAGGPVIVTHPEAQRYFLSMAETVELIVLTAALNGERGIFIPDPGQPIRILDLAQQLVESSGTKLAIPIVITSLRPGDKLREEFLGAQETLDGEFGGKLRRVFTPQPTSEEFDTSIEILSEAAKNRNLAGLLETISRLVPEYRPSQTLLEWNTQTKMSIR